MPGFYNKLQSKRNPSKNIRDFFGATIKLMRYEGLAKTLS